MEDNKDIVDYDKMSIDEKIKFHKFYFDTEKNKILDKLSVNIGENESYWNYYKNKLYYYWCYYDEVISNKIVNAMIYIGPIPKIKNNEYYKFDALENWEKNHKKLTWQDEWYWDYEWCSDGYKKAIHKRRSVLK